MRPFLLGAALLLLGLVGALAFAAYRWRAATAGLRARLRQQRAPSAPAKFSAAELAGLPAPVARYFRAVLREGQPIVGRARLSQLGRFLVPAPRNGWRPFTATESFTTQPPGFVWDARVRLAPGLRIWVRDGLVAGAGSVRASLMGLLTVASSAGTPEIAAGALHRYLAEAVWFPTALLPSQGVVWTPLDESSARATLTVGPTTVSLDYRFGPDGLVESVFTPERARSLGSETVPTPWRGRFFDYVEWDGMRIPLSGEVEWELPAGPQPYWRGHVIDASFEQTTQERRVSP